MYLEAFRTMKKYLSKMIALGWVGNAAASAQQVATAELIIKHVNADQMDMQCISCPRYHTVSRNIKARSAEALQAWRKYRHLLTQVPQSRILLP